MKKRILTTEEHFSTNRLVLFLLDFIIYLTTSVMLVVVHNETPALTVWQMAFHILLFGITSFIGRLIMLVYKQIWRYGGIQTYIRMVIGDAIGFVLFFAAEKCFSLTGAGVGRVSGVKCLTLVCVNLLLSMTMRMFYRYAYKTNGNSLFSRTLQWLLCAFIGSDAKKKGVADLEKIKVAIVGAGRVGTSLAEELIANEKSAYYPACFIDIDKEKMGRIIFDIPVIGEESVNTNKLSDLGVQEIIFAIPKVTKEKKKELYDHYSRFGCAIKAYDYPVMKTAGKLQLRPFEIEDLLFRKPIVIVDDETKDFYSGKTILITGGGGSIGSEICRQLSAMNPRRLVILDIAENGAYDIQQEMRIKNPYLDVKVEICSITNRSGLERVFEEYRPHIVVMAAAHKHVPLMEKNCVEAVANNVFGTLNTVELAEKYKVQRVIMVSTDKAVNPTNIMGATKRMCEMIVRAHSESDTETTFSATRFGNVLGSAGSVIPLFKKQIENGGPVTITDKRIIRYFMTIPEASQLVLESGAMAKNGELFVLDMGEPVKIYELAENMIKMSGMEPGEDIEIREIGLRPGEKLYEELLVKSETLGKTKNTLIFTERDCALSMESLEEKLSMLREAVETGNDETVRAAMKKAVDTYVDPDEINRRVS